MARPEPRRPDWLAVTPPGATAVTQAGQQRDETVRALVFPATASRPTTAAAAHSTARRPAGGPVSLLKSTAPAPPGSTLGPEPAYRSALDRLLQRPATAPGTASAARGGGSAGSAAPALPSSRLDTLLAGGRPTSTVQKQPQQQERQSGSTSLDSLLRRPPVPATATHRAPLPSSRLEELLARPATATCISMRPAGSDSTAAEARPSTAAGGGTSLRLAGPAAAGHGTAAPPAKAAALSPVDEEPLPASGLRHFPSRSTAAGSAGPRSAGSGGSAGPPATDAVGLHAGAPHEAGPGAAAAVGLPSVTGAAAPSAAAAVAALDPGLHDRLRERIEQAKAQVRQQLSPMFRLSDALLGAGQDPGRAAQALDAATGLAASGFEQLAARPGSRGGGGSGATGSQPAGKQVAGPAAGPTALLPQSGGSMQQRERQPPGIQDQRQPHQEQQALPDAWDGADAAEQHPAFAAGASSAEEVDSLVANARAAAARAQSAIAGLTSPPRLHAATASGAAGAMGGTPTSSSAPRPAAPLPQAQQRRDQPPAAELQLAAHGGSGSSQLALPAGYAQAMLALLREQSEALIRSECERMVAGMHAVLDSLLGSLLQAQHAAQQAQQQQAQQQVAHQQQQEVQLEGGGQQPTSEAAQPAGAAGSRGGSEAGDASAAGGLLEVEVAEGHEEGQQAWELQQQAAGDPAQQPGSGAAAAVSSGDEPFAFSLTEPQQQWEQQQQQWEQAQHSPDAASPSTGSPPELPNLGGGPAGAGFGSPFKLPSHHPSPAKHPAAERAQGQAAPSRAVQQGQQQEGQYGQHGQQQLGTTPKSLTFAPLPAAAAGTPTWATPALLRPGGAGLDAYRTARSMASIGPTGSPGGSVASSGGGVGSSSRMASSGGGGGGGAAASPGYFSSWSGGSKTPASSVAAGLPTPLLGGAAGAAGGKDMDDILGSIRRLAAEMRMKQGILAVPPTPAAPAVAASVTKPPC